MSNVNTQEVLKDNLMLANQVLSLSTNNVKFQKSAGENTV